MKPSFSKIALLASLCFSSVAPQVAQGSWDFHPTQESCRESPLNVCPPGICENRRRLQAAVHTLMCGAFFVEEYAVEKIDDIDQAYITNIRAGHMFWEALEVFEFFLALCQSLPGEGKCDSEIGWVAGAQRQVAKTQERTQSYLNSRNRVTWGGSLLFSGTLAAGQVPHTPSSSLNNTSKE